MRNGHSAYKVGAITLVVAFAASIYLSAGAQTSSDAAGADMDVRCRQAAKLKGMADDYVRQVKEFHKQAQVQIAEARKLKGEARYLQGQTNATPTAVPVKLSPAQAHLAMNQYQGDLTQFLQHAQAYNDHMQNFDREMGQCHANEDRYQANLKDYELHLQQFHLPNLQMPNVAINAGLIRPPHICKAMNLSQGEAATLAGQYLGDQARVLEAEQQLNKAETELSVARQGASLADAKLETEIVRGQREKSLAIEFGKLKEEYDMLVVERNTLASLNGKGAYPAAKNVAASTAGTKVQGKVVR